MCDIGWYDGIPGGRTKRGLDVSYGITHAWPDDRQSSRRTSRISALAGPQETMRPRAAERSRCHEIEEASSPLLIHETSVRRLTVRRENEPDGPDPGTTVDIYPTREQRWQRFACPAHLRLQPEWTQRTSRPLSRYGRGHGSAGR